MLKRITGTLALLGAVMIIPLFVPSRWRGGRARYDDGFTRPSEHGLLQ